MEGIHAVARQVRSMTGVETALASPTPVHMGIPLGISRATAAAECDGGARTEMTSALRPLGLTELRFVDVRR